MKNGVAFKTSYFSYLNDTTTEKKEASPNTDQKEEKKEADKKDKIPTKKELPFGVMPLLGSSIQNGKVIGVVHAVSVGVSKHPVSDEEFAPGATKELRTCAFIAKACAERICELRGIPFTQDDRERYFYEFDPVRLNLFF
ncbi:unnamed protein product [Meloidogyne enterolobii]|uniref:Uncharacterized protein n=1 Tax=Meloidogyne enterolobii TaxID=390850 RepID=A0ACB0YXN9_MELEN